MVTQLNRTSKFELWHVRWIRAEKNSRKCHSAFWNVWINKASTVLHSFLIINLDRMLFRIATETKWPPRWMYYESNAYISAKMWISALTKAYLWSTSDGKASWTGNGHQWHWQGTKPASGKTANCSYSALNSLFRDSSFMVVHTARIISHSVVQIT